MWPRLLIALGVFVLALPIALKQNLQAAIPNRNENQRHTGARPPLNIQSTM
jgi:hypothetical protein